MEVPPGKHPPGPERSEKGPLRSDSRAEMGGGSGHWEQAGTGAGQAPQAEGTACAQALWQEQGWTRRVAWGAEMGTLGFGPQRGLSLTPV